MDKNCLNNEWFSVKNVILKGDGLYSDGVPSVQMYNPFDYYKLPVSVQTITHVLGSKRSNLQPMPLHVLFASLNPNDNDQIIRWINHFGPLRVASLKPSVAAFLTDDISKTHFEEHTVNAFLGSLESIKTDISAFRIILDLLTTKDFLSDKDYSLLFDSIYGDIHLKTMQIYLKREILPEDSLPEKIETLKFSINAHESIGGDKITLLINDFLGRNISTTLIPSEKSYALSWEFKDLLPALYLMLAFDLSGDKHPTQCSNPLCQRYFTPAKTGALYCSDTCQNRAKQQRYRAKQKQIESESSDHQK